MSNTLAWRFTLNKKKGFPRIFAVVISLAVLAFILSPACQGKPNLHAPESGSPVLYPTPGVTHTVEKPVEELPPCQFNNSLPSNQQDNPVFEEYEFSEPKVVLTNTEPIMIASWLPDNQRLLLV